MLGGKQSGMPFHGEVDTANATAGVLFTLYPSGSSVEYILGANDQVVIESYSVVTDTLLAVSLQIGTSYAAGKRLRSGKFAANSGMAGSDVELVCTKGVKPAILASDVGTVNAQIEGRIFKFNG